MNGVGKGRWEEDITEEQNMLAEKEKSRFLSKLQSSSSLSFSFTWRCGAASALNQCGLARFLLLAG